LVGFRFGCFVGLLLCGAGVKVEGLNVGKSLLGSSVNLLGFAVKAPTVGMFEKNIGPSTTSKEG